MGQAEVQETSQEREAREMHNLALRVSERLEREARFDPDDAAASWEDGVATLDEMIPDEIRNYLGEDFGDDPELALRDAYEQWSDDEMDSVLDVSGRVSFVSGGVDLVSLTVVLGTGGPHVEVTFDDSGRGYVTAYGWFGAHKTEIPVDIEGHPIAGMWDLFCAEVERRV